MKLPGEDELNEIFVEHYGLNDNNFPPNLRKELLKDVTDLVHQLAITMYKFINSTTQTEAGTDAYCKGLEWVRDYEKRMSEPSEDQSWT